MDRDQVMHDPTAPAVELTPKHAESDGKHANTPPAELFVRYFRTWDFALAVNDEVLSDLPTEIGKARRFPDVIEGLGKLYLKAMKLVEAALREHVEIRREIDRRLHSNGISFNFGLLLISHRSEDFQMQAWAYHALQRFMRGRLWKKGWSRPSREPWDGSIDEALTEQCNKLSHLDPLDVFFKMLGNEFAYIHDDVISKCIDDLRKEVRIHKHEQLHENEFFTHLQSPKSDPDQRLQAEDLLRLIRSKRPDAPAHLDGMLEALEKFLESRDELDLATVSKLAAWFVKEMSATRGVSEVTSRKYRERFKKEAEADMELLAGIRNEIGGLVPNQRINVRLSEVGLEDEERE